MITAEEARGIVISQKPYVGEVLRKIRSAAENDEEVLVVRTDTLRETVNSTEKAFRAAKTRGIKTGKSKAAWQKELNEYHRARRALQNMYHDIHLLTEPPFSFDVEQDKEGNILISWE